jgi:hypothetical protein
VSLGTAASSFSHTSHAYAVAVGLVGGPTGRSLQDLVAFLSELHALKIDLFLHQQGLTRRHPPARRCFRCWVSLPNSNGR